MFGQVRHLTNRRVAVQVILGRIQPQAVIAQLAAHIRPMLWPLQRDDNIRLTFGQADEVRQRQNIHRNRRVGINEVAQLRGNEEAAEALRATHAHMPRQRHARPGHLLAGHVQRAFDRLGIAQQALAFGGQHKTVGPRLFEQQRTQGPLQRADAP